MAVTFVWWWMIPLALVASGLVLWRTWHGFRARNLGSATAIAHSERLTTIPRYRALLTRHRRMLAAMIAAASLVAIGAIGMLARPLGQATTQPELHNRDIMLCLDVSGSMSTYNEALLGTFADLAAQFDGERVGLTIWDSSAVRVFPLTTDYAYVSEQLTLLAEQFRTGSWDMLGGTYNGDGSSLIGDGLATCVLNFDAPDVERSRSIVMATDNYVAGAQIVTLPEAAQFAADRDIRLYAINAWAWDAQAPESVELREAAETTDGGYYIADNEGQMADLVHEIEETEAQAFDGAPQVTQFAEPRAFLVLAGIGIVALLALAWRAGL